MRQIAIILFAVGWFGVFAQTREVTLHEGWKFRKVGEGDWLPAIVPGTVHTDLLANNIIPDPFMGLNEKLVQWVDSVDWEYTTTFRYQPTSTTREAYLHFDGLDTYAEIYLNDTLIISANNMFRWWKVEVSKLLQNEENSLRIVFRSAIKKGKEEVKKLPYILPGEEKVFTRKAAYHYGWDWGPRFVTCGIWKPVKLILVEGPLQVQHHQVIQEEVSEAIAKLRISSEVKVGSETDVVVQVYDHHTGKLLSSVSGHLTIGTQKVDSYVTIDKPRLWWPNGLGEAHLYQFRIEMKSALLEEKVSTILPVGIRKVELVQEKDSVGKSFYFSVNGKAIFMKGANIIPPDNFLPRVSKTYYKELVNKAKTSNMNMLRVWGGGVYPDDEFFTACDEAGILVWQDFMFANTPYPGSDDFIENVREEATQQIIRLRNHPSIALWCGNNEISEGWYNWGWQKQYKYSDSDSSTIWNDYLQLFESEFAAIVNKWDGSRAYWPSSPKNGWGRKASLLEGDLHYWGVWWGLEPFKKYREKVGRFVSEYGFQSLPASYLFEKVASDDSLTLDSDVVKHHQKHPTGYQTIDHYLTQSYKMPVNFTDYCYVSQLVQADGMKTAIEAHRNKQPYCMGTLFWQLNDCWPVTSWSSVDYYNTPKAAYYFIKDAFKNDMLSVVKESNGYKIYATADVVSNSKVKLVLTLMDFSGDVKHKEVVPITNYHTGNQLLHSVELIDLYSKVKPTNMVWAVTLYSGNKELDEYFYYFAEPKNLLLEKPNLKVRSTAKRNEFIISTDKLAKNVVIEGCEGIEFSDNYFDLLPGTSKTIEIKTGNKTFNELKKVINVKSLYDIYP